MFRWILILVGFCFAGSSVLLSFSNNMKVYGIKPACKANSSDTITGIPLDYATHFSFGFNGKGFPCKDTAIIDSGFQVKVYENWNNSSTNMITPSTADSIIDLFDNAGDNINQRKARSKGLSLDAMPYLFMVFKRTDTNADTLDFKSSTGVADSTRCTITIRKEK